MFLYKKKRNVFFLICSNMLILSSWKRLLKLVSTRFHISFLRKFLNNYGKCFLFLLVIKRFTFLYLLLSCPNDLVENRMFMMPWNCFEKFLIVFFRISKRKFLNKNVTIGQVIDHDRKKTSEHIWKPERLVTSSF